MTAVHLLRRAPASTRVVLIERSAEAGRGLAYARRDFPYLLNVPAMRMSAYADAPNDFLEFARKRLGVVEGGEFVSRELYGDYLAGILDSAAAQAGSRLQLLQATVTDVQPRDDGGFRVVLGEGTFLSADDVVVASGHPPPADPRRLVAGACDETCVEEPWACGAKPAGPGALLLIGTSLTMADVVCAELARDPEVRIHAVSRHGLLPLSQARAAPVTPHDNRFEAELRTARGMLELMRLTRREAAATAASGGDWRDTIMRVRHELPGIWAAIGDTERQRFLRHVRPYWDIHRHRLPERIAHMLLALVRSGRLTVHAGRLTALNRSANGISASWRPRGSRADQRLDVARVVNCTGADYDVTHAADPLWHRLLERGLVLQDALRTGLVTDAQMRLAARPGRTGRQLHYVGPMLRAAEWEATAVPELRSRAERLAGILLQN